VDDYHKMIAKFQNLEENVIKLMIQKQNLEKEIEGKMGENKNEILDLEIREKKANEERDMLLTELYGVDKLSRDLIKQSNEEGRNTMILNMMKELYLILTGEEDDYPGNKRKIKKEEINPIKDLADALRVIMSIKLES
jgi:hypothetical protein